MPSITQKITSYVHGISQQPDYLKKSGQVRDALNVLPSVTNGLTKRPGSDLITTLDTTINGKWFTIFRDANEKYIGQIKDGKVSIWSLIDGLPRLVRYNSTPDLTKPEDGGVGLPTPPGEDPPVVNPPSTSPPGCFPDDVQKALSEWEQAKAATTAAKNDYNNKVNHYNTVAANPTYERVIDSSLTFNPTPGTYYNYGQGAPRVTSGYYTNPDGSISSVNLPSNAVGPDGYGELPIRSQTQWNIITGYTPRPSAIYYTVHVYRIKVREGTYDQATINAARAARDDAYTVLVRKEQEEEVKKLQYEASSRPCNVKSFRRIGANPSPVVPYLNVANPEDNLDTLTINDYTFILNRTSKVTMNGDKSQVRPYEAFVTVKALEYNNEYKLVIAKPTAGQTTVYTYAKSLTISPGSGWVDGDPTCPLTDTQTFDRSQGSAINLRYQIETRGTPIPNGTQDYDCRYDSYVTLLNGGQGWLTGDSWTVNMKGRSYTIRVASHGIGYTYNSLVPTTPYLSPKDQTTGTLKKDEILNHFKADIEKVSGWTCQLIGDGMYIKGPEQFSLYTSGGRSDAALEGFTNKVNNISKLPIQCKDGYIVKILNTGEQEDDYYVKFIGTEPGVDGAGAWEETVKPGINTTINYYTMPHQIVRMPNGSFMVSPVAWDPREVGDTTTNPTPSFVERTINKMFFYRNRLGLLSDENVILSRAGDFFNYFSKTALTVSEADPIDLAASSTVPAVLHDAIPMNPGLILFSRDRQFILTTANDVLTPIAVKLEVLSTYACFENLRVFDMGTTIGFLASGGNHSRLWEMTNISAGGTPEVIEQSKIVSELLPAKPLNIADSKENDLLVLAERNSQDLYCYKYFNDGEKRILSSWFKWKIEGNLIFHSIDTDIHYTVTQRDGVIYLSKRNLVSDTTDFTVDTKVPYEPFLDCVTLIAPNSITYDPGTHESSFLSTYKYDTDAVVYTITNARFRGYVAKILRVVPEAGKYRIYVKGKQSDLQLALGYNYKMSVTLPHHYMVQESSDRSVADTRAYLTIHRLLLNMGKIGMYDIIINSIGKALRRTTYEASPANSYGADYHEVLPEAIRTIPIYEKNTNYTLSIESTHPTPCTLYGASWEGRVTVKGYKSV